MEDALDLGRRRVQLGPALQPADHRHDVAEADHGGQRGQAADQLDGTGIERHLLVGFPQGSFLGRLAVVEAASGEADLATVAARNRARGG